tara:strand:+ start:99632 stop:99787 length:156 start_codon:yes stop_codon:yes gene_type:complete
MFPASFNVQTDKVFEFEEYTLVVARVKMIRRLRIKLINMLKNVVFDCVSRL